MERRHPEVLTQIAEKKVLDDQLRAALEGCLSEFGKQFSGSAQPAAVA